MRTTITLLVFLTCFSVFLTGCQNDASPASASPVPAENQAYVPKDYRLVWNDEFDYEGLPDSSRWGYQTGGHGWTAKELQLYTKADPENVNVTGGQLHLTARVKKTARNNFTSARLVTKQKADFKLGYFEVRARFPEGEGIRSALWMVGDTVSKIGWPTAGEIDVVEHYGTFPTVVNAAVQSPEFNWSGKGQKGGSRIVKTATSEFHVYSCEWTDNLMTFAVDGEPYFSYAPIAGRGKLAWPFHWPFYLAVNVSVGGIRGPESKGLSPEDFPATMLIDYVRVYQR